MSWPTVRLGDVCEIRIGRTPSRSKGEYWGEGFPWLSIADMSRRRQISTTREQITAAAVRETGGFLVDPRTVLLSFKLTIGRVALSEVPLYTNEAIAALPIRRPETLDADYLAWALDALDIGARTNRAAMGATLNRGMLEAIRIPYPPLDHQRRIARVLDAAEHLRRIRSHWLSRAAEILQAEFAARFDGRGRTIPLADLVDQSRPITYGILKPGEDVPNGVPYVRVVDIQDGRIHPRGVRRTSAAIAREYRRSTLHQGDVVMSIRGHVGRLAIVPPELEGANITQDSARLAVTGADPRYVVEAIRSSTVQRWMERYVKGVAVRGINLADVRRIPIPEASPTEQRDFAARAAGVDQMLNRGRQHLAALDELFATLQHRAFTEAH